MELILHNLFTRIDENSSKTGDIIVWKGIPPESTPHSAIIENPVIIAGQLGDMSKLLSKNGIDPEAEMALDDVIRYYGESYEIFRRNGQ